MYARCDSGARSPDRLGAQFDRSPTRKAGEGTGLGLAIARQLVRLHGGDIIVGLSELGGALFTVQIPTTPRVDVARAEGARATLS